METKEKKPKFKLFALRKNKGFSREEAAKLIGISPDTLYNWETYKSYPSIKHIPKIEFVYEVSYDDINFLPEYYD